MVSLAFGFGNPVEIAIIAGVIVLLFGGSKLAGFGKSLGEGIKGFKQGMDEEPEEKSPSSPGPPVAAGKTEESK